MGGWTDLSTVTFDDSAAILAGPLLTMFFFFAITIISLSTIVRKLFFTTKNPDNRPAFGTNTIISTLYVAYLAYLASTHKTGIAQIISGTDPKLQQVLSLAPLISQGPNPAFFLGNRHIQFIPWMTQNEFVSGMSGMREQAEA